jgi:prepilin-type N-terminal cleavage/methylation domain-containing protein
VNRRSGPRGRDGFTLVEVLAAMVILAVGLMALEAMGIGAARSVARADEVSEYTAVATDQLERTLAKVVRGPIPATGSATVNGANVFTQVSNTNGGGQRFYTVSVTVTPPSAARARLHLQPVTVVGSAIVDPTP